MLSDQSISFECVSKSVLMMVDGSKQFDLYAVFQDHKLISVVLGHVYPAYFIFECNAKYFLSELEHCIINTITKLIYQLFCHFSFFKLLQRGYGNVADTLYIFVVCFL